MFLLWFNWNSVLLLFYFACDKKEDFIQVFRKDEKACDAHEIVSLRIPALHVSVFIVDVVLLIAVPLFAVNHRDNVFGSRVFEQNQWLSSATNLNES